VSALSFLPVSIERSAVAAVVGLVSDTHFPQRCRQLPPALFDVLAGVDLILHAGDVGLLSVLDDLSRIAPVIAVHGNDDTTEAERELPYQLVAPVAGVRLFLWHSHYQDPAAERSSRIGDDMVEKLERTVVLAQRAGAQIAVFGHWHIPLVYRKDGVAVVNPGAIASGNEFTRQLIQSVALLYVMKDRSHHIVHVDLADPQHPFEPEVDVYGGFAAALNRYSASIVTPELAAVVPELRALLTPDELRLVRAIVAQVAHRCWAGELPVLDLDNVWEQLEQSDNLPQNLREKLLTFFAYGK
jgi:putative phosphoesterase